MTPEQERMLQEALESYDPDAPKIVAGWTIQDDNIFSPDGVEYTFDNPNK